MPASWKKILVEGDAVDENLSTANLTQSGSARLYDINGTTNTLGFKNGRSKFLNSSTQDRFEFNPEDRVFYLYAGSESRYYDDDNSGYVSFKSPTQVTSANSITIEWPSTPPTANQILEVQSVSTGVATTSWIDTPSGSGGGVTVANQADNYVITSTGTTDALNAEANMTFNGSQLAVTGRISATDFITLATNNRGLKGTTTGSSVIDLIKCNSSDSVEVGTSSTKMVLSGISIDAGSLEITCGTLNAESINAQEPSSGEITGKGAEVLNFGTSQATQQTKVYYLTTNTTSPWAQSDKDVEAAAKGFLACALGSNATDGMLLRGLVKGNGVAGSPSVGDRVYVGDDGTPTADISGFGSGDFVRVIGHMVSSAYLYYNPSQEYIELS